MNHILNLSKKEMNRKRAFTLVELLITIAITAAIGIIGFIYLFNFQNSQGLDSQAKSVVAALHYAQQQSISQDRGGQWGMSFVEGGVQPDYYTIYYWRADTGFVTTVTTTFPGNIRLAFGLPYLEFSNLSGQPVPLKNYIVLYLATDPTLIDQIVVDANGSISLQRTSGLILGGHLISSAGPGGGNTFNTGRGVAIDNINNKVYVADTGHNRIVMVDSGSGGTTIGNNWTNFGGLNQPAAVAVDAQNNKVYISDTFNNRIGMVDSASAVTTFGNNPQFISSFSSGDTFNHPSGIAVDPINNKVYVADRNNCRIIIVDSSSGSTSFGNNEKTYGTCASINLPDGIAVDSVNNKVYVGNTGGGLGIAFFDSGSGSTTLGGNLQLFLGFGYPSGISVDTTYNKLYVADFASNQIVAVDSGSNGTTLGNNRRTFGVSLFSQLWGVAVDTVAHKVYAQDWAKVYSFDGQFP